MNALRHVNPVAILVTLAVLSALAGVGLHRMTFETDIVASLPETDPVIAAARDILHHHPGQDLVAVDLHLESGEEAPLGRAMRAVTGAMAASGLFAQVGMQAVGDQMPALVDELVRHLPILFSKADLEDRVAPLLTRERIRTRLAENLATLATLEGIGQADWIARDPLALHHLLMAELARLSPAPGVRPFQGHLISGDGKHVLVVATPAQASTDTTFGRRLDAFFNELQAGFQSPRAAGPAVDITPLGAYRAALDNEMLARRDTRRIVGFAMAGIAVLLFLTFPRPWIGLLAFVPAVAGTVTALFVMSLLQSRLSVLTLGFGGAVISITVDHGIAYLLFLDRTRETRGEAAAREVRAVGLIATLTTVGAFLSLNFSGFPVLGEIGRFAALGIGSAFLFVHLVMPRLIPSLPPARRTRPPVLQRLLARGTGRLDLKAFWAGLAVLAVLALFAAPRFAVDLRAMNSVTDATRAAETRVQAVWGRFMERAFVMTHADSLEDLLDQGDRVAALLEDMAASGALAPGFLPATFFPGRARAAANRAAWEAFWTPARVAAVSTDLQLAGAAAGFAEGAFAPFITLLNETEVPRPLPQPGHFELLGIVPDADGSGWRQFFTLKPGRDYQAAGLYQRLEETGAGQLFDPVFFAERLGGFLADTFRNMLVVVGISALVLLGFFFWDLTLTALALLPLAGAFLGTLGVLGLMGRPLDIPALMLAIIVLGMGIDYALFTIRAFQRYGRETDPALALFRTTVFLAAGSTLVGFGALISAEHAVFRSAGVISFCGILFSVAGTFILLPPLLRRLFGRPSRQGMAVGGGPAQAGPAARLRFRHLEITPRWAAWRKLRKGGPMDRFPLQGALQGAVALYPVGWGVEAAWLAEAAPGLRIVGADPDAEKIRVAARVTGEDRTMRVGGPEALADGGDAAPVTIMVLTGRPGSDEDPAALLRAAGEGLAPGGRLIVLAEAAGPPSRRQRWRRWLRPGPRPFAAEATEAALRGVGYARIERHGLDDGDSLGWVCAVKD